MCPYLYHMLYTIHTIDFIDVVSKLSTTIIAAAAAIVAYIIGRQQVQINKRQWQTDRDRLKFELFDKRYAVFEGIKQFMRTIANSDSAEWHTIIKFLVDTSGAKFLFTEDKKITDFITTLSDKAREFHVLQAQEKKALETGDEEGNQQKQNEIILWYVKHLEEVDDLFKDYLVLKH